MFAIGVAQKSQIKREKEAARASRAVKNAVHIRGAWATSSDQKKIRLARHSIPPNLHPSMGNQVFPISPNFDD
jgi:hypothetical protein